MQRIMKASFAGNANSLRLNIIILASTSQEMRQIFRRDELHIMKEFQKKRIIFFLQLKYVKMPRIM